MKYQIAVLGNDEAAFEMLNLAAGSGLRCLSIIPHVRHSAWLVGQALRRLVSDLLVDRTAQRRRTFARAGRPSLLKSLLSRSVAGELSEHIRMLDTIGVDVLLGEASLSGKPDGPGPLCLSCDGRRIETHHVVICTGVRRAAMHQPVSTKKFHGPDSIFTGRRLPRSAVFIGGGELGAGLSALVSLFGTETRLVARPDTNSVMLELAESTGVKIGQHPLDVGLSSSLVTSAEDQVAVVDCRRSIGFTDHLNLASVGVDPDENGQLWCAGNFETWHPGLFGAGAVVGFSPDSALHPTVQAERIIGRIRHKAPRPHLLRNLQRVSA